MRSDRDPRPPGIVGVIRGDPHDPLTWSGTSVHLFAALAEAGALVAAVDATAPPPLEALAKVLSFAPNLDRWRDRYNTSVLHRRLMTAVAARRIARSVRAPDALMQVGAWCDLAHDRRVRPRLRCSYHDGNLAVVLRRADMVMHPGSRSMQRALEFERRLYDNLDLIMPMSRWLRDSFVHDFEQDPAKVVVVGAGANIARIPDPPNRDFTRPRFLFVGIDFVRKGGRQVLTAFGKVREARPDAELWVVGRDAPAEAHPGVRFFGRIHRNTAEGEALLDRLYRQATAFVMPSLFEPFGIVFLEAMAYRLPCVGADRCAMPEIIEDGATGYLVPPEDADAIADRLMRLIEQPETAAVMGEAGYHRFLDRYTWDGVARRIVGETERRLES